MKKKMNWLIPVGIGVAAVAIMGAKKVMEPEVTVVVEEPMVQMLRQQELSRSLANVGVASNKIGPAIAAMSPAEQEMALQDPVFLISVADTIAGHVEV